MLSVYVVVNLELGWDNIVAVYSGNIDIEDIEKAYPSHGDRYHIFVMDISSLEDLKDIITERQEIDTCEEE